MMTSRLSWVLRLVAAVTLVVVIALTSSATRSYANLTGSSFEGSDGNLIVNTSGNTDWANVAGRIGGVDLASGSADDAFGQGTKEDNAAVTIVDGSIPPNKSDLTRFYEASDTVGTAKFLYLAWERSNVLGSANMDFEINQKTTAGWTGSTTGALTINRTAGDLLVTYDFTNGGSVPVLGLNIWLTAANGDSASNCLSSSSLPCWGKHLNLNSSNSEGAINTTTVIDPIAPNAPRSLPASTFGEAAINLTGAGVFPAGTCKAFGSAFLKSRSSNSFSAEVKDFVAPVPISISNCAPPTLTTQPDANTLADANGGFALKVPVGSAISDTAKLSGTFGAVTGSIAFNLYFVPAGTTPANPCGGTPVFTDTKTISGGTATSGNYTTGTAYGTYYWQDVYTPDSGANYTTTTETCGAETVQLVDARILLTPHSATNVINNQHVLTATLQSTTDGTWVSGGLSSASPTTISFSFVGTTHAVWVPSGVNTCVANTTTGACSVTINDGTVETVTVHAAASNVQFTGVTGTFNVSTGTGNSDTDATKTYINLKTTLSVKDALTGLPNSATGSVSYTYYTNSTCTGTGTSAGGGGALSLDGSGNLVVPSSDTVSVGPGTTVYFTSTYTGNLGTFTTACNESASSGS